MRAAEAPFDMSTFVCELDEIKGKILERNPICSLQALDSAAPSDDSTATSLDRTLPSASATLSSLGTTNPTAVPASQGNIRARHSSDMSWEIQVTSSHSQTGSTTSAAPQRHQQLLEKVRQMGLHGRVVRLRDEQASGRYATVPGEKEVARENLNGIVTGRRRMEASPWKDLHSEAVFGVPEWKRFRVRSEESGSDSDSDSDGANSDGEYDEADGASVSTRGSSDDKFFPSQSQPVATFTRRTSVRLRKQAIPEPSPTPTPPATADTVATDMPSPTLGDFGVLNFDGVAGLPVADGPPPGEEEDQEPPSPRRRTPGNARVRNLAKSAQALPALLSQQPSRAPSTGMGHRPQPQPLSEAPPVFKEPARPASRTPAGQQQDTSLRQQQQPPQRPQPPSSPSNISAEDAPTLSTPTSAQPPPDRLSYAATASKSLASTSARPRQPAARAPAARRATRPGTEGSMHLPLASRSKRTRSHNPVHATLPPRWDGGPVLPPAIDGHSLDLLHLSNGFRVCTGAPALKVGDVVKTVLRIETITNSDTGKTITIPIIEVASSFFYRGKCTDFSQTFSRVTQPTYSVPIKTPQALAVLRAKESIRLDDDSKPLEVGTTLHFKLESHYGFHDKSSYTMMNTTGGAYIFIPELQLAVKLATLDYTPEGEGNCRFAGHSLEEYSALASIADISPISVFVDVVYRGITMQRAVKRDHMDRSSYIMVATDPGHIGKTSGDAAERGVVETISRRANILLKLVDFNIEGHNVLNFLKVQKIDLVKLTETMLIEQVKEHLCEIVDECVQKARDLQAKTGFVTLERGFATIPLPGIDVPFHSRYLWAGGTPFRTYLSTKVNPAHFDTDLLIGRYMPNLTAVPYEVNKEYAERIHTQTSSPRSNKILSAWDEERWGAPENRNKLGYAILVELLAYQLASPCAGSRLRTSSSRTSKAHDSALGIKRAIYCIAKNQKEIYYQNDDVTDDAPAPAAAAAAPSAAAPKAAAAPVAAAPPPPAPVAAAPAAAVADEPLKAVDTLRIIIAQKLKKPVAEVPLTKTIKELVGGKSTLRNEILGDLQSEFASAPEKGEEMPLSELGAALNQGYPGSLGKCTTGLVARMMGGKMPGGFGLSAAKAHLAKAHGLGPGRTDGTLLVALTVELEERLGSEADAKAWLDSVASAYAAQAGISLGAAGGGGGGGAIGGGMIINTEQLDKPQEKQDNFVSQQVNLFLR
ncbi:hypothetical protein JCM8115_002011 [Rhodotorula mucilaginosa]